MYRIKFLFGLLILGLNVHSQNDIDAIRYSRYGI